MLNAIGLQGIGVHRYIAEKLPELRRLGATNVINICGSTLDEYVEARANPCRMRRASMRWS
jgi:dihydroorotate dehydrogenase (NAD+) catalytic subunit